MKTQTLGVILTLGVLLIACSSEERDRSRTLEAREIPAGPQCDQYGSVKQQLQTIHKEKIVLGGINHHGTMRMEIYATSNGSTWSLIFVGIEGWTCLVAAGTGLRMELGEKVSLQQLVEKNSVRTY